MNFICVHVGFKHYLINYFYGERLAQRLECVILILKAAGSNPSSAIQKKKDLDCVTHEYTQDAPPELATGLYHNGL